MDAFQGNPPDSLEISRRQLLSALLCFTAVKGQAQAAEPPTLPVVIRSGWILAENDT